MKKALSLCLCLALILVCFSACSKEEPLVGTWDLDISLVDAFAANGVDFESQFGTFSADSRLRGVRMTFSPDGTVTTSASLSEITTSIETFVQDFFTYLEEGGIYDFFQASGIGREQIDTYMSMQGKTVPEFLEDMKAQMAETLDIPKLSKELAESFVESGIEENAQGVYESTDVYEIREEGVLLTADKVENLNHGTAFQYRITDEGATLILTSDGVSTTFRRQAD